MSRIHIITAFLLGINIEKFLINLFTCTHIGSFLLPAPYLPPPPSPLHFQAEPVLPLSLILLKRRHKYNKKDKAFLLVELRVAVQRDS
jgi:hypothetical protein